MEWGLFPLQIAFQNGDGAPTEPASGLAYLAASRDDERDRAEDDGARHEHLGRDLLAEQEGAERDRDDRVHVGVRGDEGDRRVTKEPDVGDEADEGADDDEIGDRAERVCGGMQVAELAARRAGDEEERTAAEGGEPGRDERPLRERRSA